MCADYSKYGPLSAHQLRYKYRLIKGMYERVPDVKSELTAHWIKRLVDNDISNSILQRHGIIVPEQYLPKRVTVEKIAKELATTYLYRANTTEQQRKQGIRYVIGVARQAGLSVEKYGDISALQSATLTSFVFAKRVLKAIADGFEDTLLEMCNQIQLNALNGQMR